MAKTAIKTRLNFTNIFRRNKDAFEDDQVKYIINQGGSSSGKTWAIMQLLIFIAWTNKRTITVVSSSIPHLKTGAMKYFEMIMDELGFFSEDRYNRTERVYKFPNGSTIHFKSGADAMKIKGYRTDILYVNEADEIPEESWLQFIIRTKYKAFLDFNPSRNDCWVYELQDDVLSKTIKSNFQDNTYLSETIKDELMKKKDVDPNWYRSFVLGIRPIGDDRIYNHFKLYEDIPEDEIIVSHFYGLDFGHKDPTAMVEVFKCKSGNHYIKELIYEGMTSDDLIAQLRTMDINGILYCDNARSDIIELLKRAGYNAQKSDKSIKTGIDSVRSCNIFIHKDSLNLIKESKNYTWKKSGLRILDEPIDLWNHLLDALRYAINSTRTKNTNMAYVNVY